MRTILLIHTRPDQPLSREFAAPQAALPDTRVEVVDLTQPAPDYAGLVDKIFAADSVQVW